jgi:DNA-directed RNA polymerase specialized sigma24 family protein
MFGIALMELVVEEAEALGPDPEAFRGFYERALPRIYGYFLHRCGGPAALAEDLTQETFLAAVAELKKGRRVDTPIPWIYGIAIFDLARLMGTSVKMIDETYGHLVRDSHDRVRQALEERARRDLPRESPRTADG